MLLPPRLKHQHPIHDQSNPTASRFGAVSSQFIPEECVKRQGYQWLAWSWLPASADRKRNGWWENESKCSPKNQIFVLFHAYAPRTAVRGQRQSQL